MKVTLEKYRENNWHDLQISFTKKDAEEFIKHLQDLLSDSDPNSHFHYSNTFKEKEGIADLEICISEEEGNMTIG
ncbi:MAG: hypothetical protein EYC62_09010 [Alphaproteobacteria bacterium]|nr:MAG: hypothetical protein EYC62_09010 [Alphaproteobacteria bacterium]